ncbi:BCL-6 corepressor-like protein 1 isoform X2 [Gouania willdenowi]|uniref:BCL-6 corepressor-like protein 1 isoform X2 n=1 Tax=Gouania willdenowi TaxID=441366 RepID=UPI0010563759|nr:BCL-6 corepressor-like protein 1 isoform X2 [Gouania willdenowi]
MQVDPTLMNVGDGSTVSREISAPNKLPTSMVGNPPQTLPPEFRGDVTLSQQNKTTTTKDCKTVKACLESGNCNHSTELSPSQQSNNAPMSGSIFSSSEKTDKRNEAPKPKADSTGVFHPPQWSAGLKVNREDSINPCHSNVMSNKKTHSQMQPVQGVTAGFQCATMFNPVSPVAFLPSTNFSSPLCKITLPPALTQIAALREASASQFQKDIKPQSSGVGGAPLIRTYPYPLSVGRTVEKKAGTSTTKFKSSHSSSRNDKSLEEHKLLASVVASPAIALPLQHPSLTAGLPTNYTMSPTAAICCGSALANIASQNRLVNHVEKGNSTNKAVLGSVKTPPPSAAEDHTTCSIEPRDLPLDLSAKSKRPKCLNDLPVTKMEPHHNESNQRDYFNCKKNSSALQYPILPNTQRNGSHQKQLHRLHNHQIVEPKPTWAKGISQESVKNIPGTYVGVASPILASTLRGKDGKETFSEEFQSFAKQEFISIIDQGEHHSSGGKKPSCLMKSKPHAPNVKDRNTSIAITNNCRKGALSSALLGSNNAQIHPNSGPGKAMVPYSKTAVSPPWHHPPHLPHQAPALQRKPTQASPKLKGSPVTEGCKYQGAQYSPSKTEEDQWDRAKSPLSNLASIAKKEVFETMTSDGKTQVSSVTSKKADGSEDIQTKYTPALDYPQYWSVKKRPGLSPKGDLTNAMKRHEWVNSTEPIKNSISQPEYTGLQAKKGPLKPGGQSHILGSNAPANGRRMESKLAQVLEGEAQEEDKTSDSPPGEKLEGMVASILTGHPAGEGDMFQKQTNGTNEEPPVKGKSPAIKQKTSPKKPVKEKSPTDLKKKFPGKKKLETENSPDEVSPNKKKRCATLLEQSLSAGKPDLNKEASRINTSPKKAKQSSVSENKGCPQSLQTSACVVSPKEAEATDTSFPRLRRGRRRADDARLDLWGFATPSPPPPPIPSPPSPVSPSSTPMTPVQPARRRRGRPRSKPRQEQGTQGKGKVTNDRPGLKKRQRCRSRKYQSGDYVTEKDKLEEGEHTEESDSPREDAGIPADLQTDDCLSPAASRLEAPPLRPAFTRSGTVRYQENECNDKPSGKRKFKSKHLCDSDEPKSKTKCSTLGKRAASLALDDDRASAKKSVSLPSSPKRLQSPPSNRKCSSGRSSGSDSSPKRPVPPEVRRLIVNKNAGETLLQRAARLGYQEVVQYCLEKDIREVNRRDNAGYTALHEASSRGWTQIVQMLLNHGADVNCSAQDGTRPLHDAVASDNLPIVWLLLNHGADPTLATYSGHTPIKLAHSSSMKAFLTEYFTDLEGRKELDPSLPWDFYSSSLFETDQQEPCWDFLLSDENQEQEESAPRKDEQDSDKDCLLFEFSSEPLLPCYHVQVSLTQGFCNWFLLTDVLKRLKMSSRIFRARYPHLEVVSLSQAELRTQVSVSQVSAALKEEDEEEEEEGGLVELVHCVPELQRLLGSSIQILHEEEEEEEMLTNTGKPRSR